MIIRMIITSLNFSQGRIIIDQLGASYAGVPRVGLMTSVVYTLMDTFAASVGVQPFGHLCYGH